MSLTAAEVSEVKQNPIEVWGVPFAPVTLANVLDEVDRLVVADGMPIVWASKWLGQPLPERVAGSDLVPALAARAAERGYRLFLLGGAPGIAEKAAQNLKKIHPQLQIVGIEVPPFRPLTPEENASMIERIRATAPDIVFFAASQPQGEIWCLENYEALGVPGLFQVGASIDFVAGNVKRSPLWIQRLGMEWAYRLYQEPRRLARRYFRNGTFLLRAMLEGLFSRKAKNRQPGKEF
jgi:N-acetylglucosaminyldiphosphoundecaprenol N-acetyl-beta-D-mannosaminyltransferase